MANNENIVLVGMPASGKTTIGTLLANELPTHIHIDIDSVIEKTQGMKVSDIFAKFSEDYFRKLEYDTIKIYQPVAVLLKIPIIEQLC